MNHAPPFCSHLPKLFLFHPLHSSSSSSSFSLSSHQCRLEFARNPKKMPGSAPASHPPEEPQVNVSAKTSARRPDSYLQPCRPLQPRRRVRKHSFRRSDKGRRTDGFTANGRRSGYGTPLLSWKFEDGDCSRKPLIEAGGSATRKVGRSCGRRKEAVTARKLAAGIWHLQLREVTLSGGSGKESAGASLGFELASPALPNHTMERATKWDAGCPRTCVEVFEIFNQLKLLEGQQVSTASIISSLQQELEGAQSRISELESERQLVNNKLDRFLRKLAEEKASWRSREHEKIRAIIDSMKSDLSRERKNRHRSEIVNSKLVNELAEAKLSVKRLMQDYDKERKARELTEEVCEELAKEIGEDKAEAEALKRDSMKIREEVEEERKMLQMAEVWREERVQMKLLDAKLTLEDKYLKLSKLQGELEAFLRTRPDESHARQAELLKEAIDFVKVEEMKEFTYQPPPASEDIFAVFEELQPKEITDERDIELCYAYSPASRDCNIHSVSPATDIFLEKPTRRYSNGDTDEDSDWETLSPDEERELTNSASGSEPSVNARCEGSHGSLSGTNSERNRENCEVHGEISEAYPQATKQPKKGSSITRLWRSSCPTNGEILKKNSAELMNGRLSDGRISNVALSSDCRVGEVGLSPPRLDQWSSPESSSPHVAPRSMKGCMDWPRVPQKHSLKEKLLEARMENHKTQLRHVLRQKI
ncbi:uncharacterized protein LOC110032150 [Phalaenopsis equestris]|uniref:uncharacterized protein LOC110032150 n=1 Tax=Phalaenopsis equestris TaxID=78828 RepID=UPI0009E491D4|nr:uncharacterized protein LOC110032150 [Phalaenopsis equestris]